MNTAPDTVMFVASRPDKQVLFVRRQQGETAWGFPKVGTIEHRAQLQPWTDGALIARVDSAFEPVGIERTDYFWCCPDFAITCTAVEPSARAALRRFDGPLLDQIMALIEGRADSNSTTGDLSMATSTDDLRRQLDALKRQIGPPMTDEQRREYRDAQAKAERVAQVYGDSAAPPLAGESLHDYRVRLATPYQRYSKTFKASNLYKIFDSSALSAVEDAIYNDALTEATRPTSGFREGELRAVNTPDATGRKITKYYGDPAACWSQFNPPIRHVTKFMT